MPAGYSVSGTGRTGFGTVPSAIPVPPNLFTQLGAVPGFKTNTAGAGNVISSQLGGSVSPMTLNALKTASAQFGVGSGMPGSGLETNELFGNIAGFSEGQQQKGVQNYLSEISALGPTMTNPGLAAEISARNANLAAAPDPRLAAEEQFNLWLRGLHATQGAGGAAGPWAAGGTLGPAPYGSTIGRSYPGGVAGFGYGTDDLGFPSYNMSAEPQGTYTATASPPAGGWQAPPAWNAGFATGSPYFYTGEEDFVPTAPGPNPYEG
jgi:hypothetical protein